MSSFKEFLRQSEVAFETGKKKFPKFKANKRVYILPEIGEMFLVMNRGGSKLFNVDKSITLTDREYAFVDKHHCKIAFELAGFWFSSSIVSVKAGSKNEQRCMVEYKEPLHFIKKVSDGIDFVHLHNHFEHSQLDGCFSAKSWVKRCKEVGFKALALTDHGTLSGIMDFFLEAQKVEDFKPILGVEAYVVPEYDKERKSITHLTILARNDVGWHNLMKLNTIAQKNFYYRPRIDFASLKKYGKGLLFLTGCPYSAMSRFLLNGELKTAQELYEFYCSCVDEENVYLEIQVHEFSDEQAIKEQYQIHLNLKKLVRRLKKFGLHPKVVLTNDCHFLLKSDTDIFFAIGRINMGNKGDREEKKQFDIWLKTRKELFGTFKRSRAYKKGLFDKSDFSGWCENTLKIADRCNVQLSVGQHRLPKFPLPKDFKNAEDLFDEIIETGTKKKLGKNAKQNYADRLKYETEVIKKAGFVDYFLIIWDIIQQAKKSGIYVGAARGSVAGSLVAYVIDITDVDPIRFNLLFERFLNETRVSGERAKSSDALPDIDVDFESAGREWVKRYIEEKYGRDNVGSLATYGRLQLRAAIKDIGRTVAGVGYEYLNKVTGKIYGQEWSDLVESIARYKEVEDFVEQFPDVMKIVGRCLGQVRHSSIHPAGVIISPATRIKKDGTEVKAHLQDFIPIKYQNVKGTEERLMVTEWELKEVERAGMLKLDILGIKQLDIFKMIVQMVSKRRQIAIDFSKIPLDDDKVFERFRMGDTEGVFQFKSRTQKEYQKFLKPTKFEHLIAANALLRPGPMAMSAHIDYVHTKDGDKDPEYDKGAEKVTKETFGLYIYQEQIMQAAHVVGGLSLAEADVMRTAIKKFDKEKMKRFRSDFVAGAMKIHGYEKKDAEYVWKKLEAFSGYGFNRSHSCSYAMLGYWCNYLKIYFPEEFWCANLEYSDSEDRNRYVNRIMTTYTDLQLVYPDVNVSQVRFRILTEGEIVWGLSHVKGIGGKAALEIVKARKGGKFDGLDDFLKKVKKQVVNKRVVIALILAGAFDNLYGIPKAEPEKRSKVLKDFFDSRKEKMSIELESRSEYDGAFKSLLDINFFDWETLIDSSKFSDYVALKDFEDVALDSIVTVAGVVTKIREILPKNKKDDEDKMGIVSLRQNEDEVDIVIWSDNWFLMKEKIKLDMKVAFRGIKKFDGYRNKTNIISCKKSKLWRIK